MLTGLVISGDLKVRDASDVVRAHTHRYQGLRVKIIESARLSEKYTKGVKKRAERPEFEGDLSCITWTVKRQNGISCLDPHHLWITLWASLLLGRTMRKWHVYLSNCPLFRRLYPIRRATTNSGSCLFFGMFSRIPSNMH